MSTTHAQTGLIGPEFKKNRGGSKYLGQGNHDNGYKDIDDLVSRIQASNENKVDLYSNGEMGKIVEIWNGLARKKNTPPGKEAVRALRERISALHESERRYEDWRMKGIQGSFTEAKNLIRDSVHMPFTGYRTEYEALNEMFEIAKVLESNVESLAALQETKELAAVVLERNGGAVKTFSIEALIKKIDDTLEDKKAYKITAVKAEQSNGVPAVAQ